MEYCSEEHDTVQAATIAKPSDSHHLNIKMKELRLAEMVYRKWNRFQQKFNLTVKDRQLNTHIAFNLLMAV